MLFIFGSCGLESSILEGPKPAVHGAYLSCDRPEGLSVEVKHVRSMVGAAMWWPQGISMNFMCKFRFQSNVVNPIVNHPQNHQKWVAKALAVHKLW